MLVPGNLDSGWMAMAESVDKARLLARIRDGYGAFQALLDRLTPAQITQPNVMDMWSIKDCIAHLIVHEQFALRELDCGLRGEPMDYDERDTDSINADAVIAGQGKTLEEVRAEWERSVAQVLAAIEQLPDDDFTPGSLLERQLGDTIDGAFGNNTYDHYAEHARMIRAWMSGRGL